jgi:hypothetical protein
MKLGQSEAVVLQREARGKQTKSRDNVPWKLGTHTSLVTEHHLQIQLHWSYVANIVKALDSHRNVFMEYYLIANF